jgi:hypothetical protein
MIAIFLVSFCIGLYDPLLGAGLPVIRVCGFMMGTVLLFSYVPYYDITTNFKSELDPNIYADFYQAPPVQAFIALLFASSLALIVSMLYPARYTVRMHNEVSQAINGARKLLITMRKIFDTRVQEAAGKLGEEAEDLAIQSEIESDKWHKIVGRKIVRMNKIRDSIKLEA